MTWETIGIPDALRKTAVGRNNQILASEILPTGKFPVVDQGQSFIAGYSDAEDRVIRDDLPLVIFGDHTRAVKFVDFPFILGADGTKVLKPREELFDARFFAFVLQSLKIPARGYNRHFTILREQFIPQPPLQEQRKIAAVLELVQQSVKQQEALIEITTEFQKSLSRKLFSEGLRSGAQAETEIGPLPEAWKATPLGECCHVLGGSLSYGEFLKLPPVDTVDGVKCMGVKVSDMNLPGNEIKFSTANVQKRLPLALARKKLIPPNAIVFPKRGAAIATNKKRVTTTWTVLDPNLIAVYPKSMVDSNFIFHWARSFDLKTITDPGPTPQLNKKDLTPLLMPLPPDIIEQQEIAAALSTLDVKVDFFRRREAALSDLFRTLLHLLMTAQVRVNDVDVHELEGGSAV